MTVTASIKRNKWIERTMYIILGFLVALAVFSFLIAAQNAEPLKQIKQIPNLSNKDKTSADDKWPYQQEKYYEEINSHYQGIEEKIKSLNDRISDMYYSLGIIVTLLVFGLISVYFRVDGEVAKHMQENYKKYKDDIEKIAAEAQEILQELKTTQQLAHQIYPKQQEQPKREQNDDDNGQPST